MTAARPATPAVVDASFVLRSLVRGPLPARCRAILADLTRVGASSIAPSLLAYEVTSGLARAVHFGDLTADEARQLLTQVPEF